MESGGIVRTIILTGLFLVLVCDYSTLFSQLYYSANGGNGTQVFLSGNEAKTGQTQMSLGGSNFKETAAELDIEAELDFTDLNLFRGRSKAEVLSTIKNACLPKLICELSAGAANRRLTESETSLLKLIRDTSLGALAEVTSRYHFAAHMGQLVGGVEGSGCHNFYTTCPLPGMQVLDLLKGDKLR